MGYPAGVADVGGEGRPEIEAGLLAAAAAAAAAGDGKEAAAAEWKAIVSHTGGIVGHDAHWKEIQEITLIMFNVQKNPFSFSLYFLENITSVHALKSIRIVFFCGLHKPMQGKQLRALRA